MKIFYFVTYFLFVGVVVFGQKTENKIQSLDYEPDIEPYESLVTTEKPIFKYQKNGIKLDLKIVPTRNETVLEDDFPNFPAKDIGVCVLDLSLTCIQQRIHQFIDRIRSLKEITLFGNWVKLVRTKEPRQETGERRSIDSGNEMTDIISKDVDSFFDVFALRINLPSLQGNKKKNQIDVMFDETGLVEGRGKSGKGGKGGGGKCKKMMMMMLMMVKMKMMGMMGMTAMKGMMMAGMSLMISKWMLIQKLMDAKKGGGGGGGGGPWQGGGGGGGGGGGAPLKEIILLTKASGGGGGGGGIPMDSYGAPPPSSNYGAPGGGYDGGGGGGWGRSFDTYVSPSNLISQITSHPDFEEKTKHTVADNIAVSKSRRRPEVRRIEMIAPVYETISPVYKAEDKNTSLNSSDSSINSYGITDNKTDVTSSLPLSQFVTLQSSYQLASPDVIPDVPMRDNVEQPVYVSDWKNFEPAKKWTTSQQFTIQPDKEVNQFGQDSFDKKYGYAQNHQPYGRLIKDSNNVLHDA